VKPNKKAKKVESGNATLPTEQLSIVPERKGVASQLIPARKVESYKPS